MLQVNNAKPVEYFRIKLIHIRKSNDDGLWSDHEISQEDKDQLWSTDYYLQNNKHYNPPEFINYIKTIGSQNPNYIFNIYFKYIFFSHHMDNEYQNIFRLDKDNLYELI